VSGLGPEAQYLRQCLRTGRICGGKGKPWQYVPCRRGAETACLKHARQVVAMRGKVGQAILRHFDKSCTLFTLRSAAVCGARGGQCTAGRRLYDRINRLIYGRSIPPDQTRQLKQGFERSAPACAQPDPP
jgi:hypothetical protein